MHFLWAAACLLDPRFKHFGFQKEESLTAIKTKIVNMMDDLQTVLHPQMDMATTAQDDEPAASVSSVTWSFFDRKVQQAKRTLPVQNTPATELGRYLDIEVLPRNGDPLLWWSKNAVFFPRLAPFARQFLATPATSTSSERLFSKA